MTKPSLRSAAAMLFALLLTACTATEVSDSEDTGTSADGADAQGNLMASYTHKMLKNTDENMFSALAYECDECSFEQFAAIDPPEGWSKGPTQLILITGEIRSTPSVEGAADSMDFVSEIPGNEYKLIAKTLDGKLIEAGANGLMVETQVMRDTILRFAAGSRVHELTDPEENTFVLFAYGIDPATLESPEFQDADALADFSGPEGWSYSTRILEEELALDTPDIATVLAIRGEVTSTWQKR